MTNRENHQSLQLLQQVRLQAPLRHLVYPVVIEENQAHYDCGLLSLVDFQVEVQ